MRKLLMTWVADRRRWTKKYQGRMHVVSCKALGTEESKEASWQAANGWWEAKKLEIDATAEQPDPENALRVLAFVKNYENLDEETRRWFLDQVLGEGEYDAMHRRNEAKLDVLFGQPADPDRSVKAQVEAWGKFLQAAALGAGQISEGRYDAYLRNIGVFRNWIGGEAAIDAIDAGKLEGYFTELSLRVSAKKYSAAYAHQLLMTAKQFISRLAELGLIPLPGNIRSRRFRFNHSAPKQVETFTDDEVQALLAGCDGFSERTRLYLLLMVNCGMYQSDISDLGEDEFDLAAGTLMRARSKTPGSQTVRYKLWPETLALLKKLRATEKVPNDRGSNRVLLTERGEPLVKYWLEGNRMRRYDVIQSAWSRLTERVQIKKPMKLLRKTSASKLAAHPQYKYYINYFLSHSPRSVADKHYVIPSDKEFFDALNWLRLRYGLGGRHRHG